MNRRPPSWRACPIPRGAPLRLPERLGEFGAEDAPVRSRATALYTGERLINRGVIKMDASQFGGYLNHANEGLRHKARAAERPSGRSSTALIAL